MSEHVLRLKCPTWEHVETFYASKVKDGSLVSARVPFAPPLGEAMRVTLELPDGEEAHVHARVADVRDAPDGRRSAVLLRLADFSALRSRLEAAVREARRGGDQALPLMPLPRVEAPRTRTGLLVPVPGDAPVDERAETPAPPSSDGASETVRALCRELEAELAAMREKAAHEVLGIDYDAGVAEIRAAYFELTKRFHPDLHARHRSPAVGALVSEIFIHVNRAYDRLREAAVAAGQAIAPGPALLPHDGYLAGFDDLGTVKPPPPRSLDELSRSMPVARISDVPFEAGALFADLEPEESGAVVLSDDGSGVSEVDVEELRAAGLARLEAGDHEGARAALAEALEHEPRHRVMRALYHVAYGRTLAAAGRRAEALTNYEVALVHDPECEPARRAIEDLRPRRERRPSLLQRLFRR